MSLSGIYDDLDEFDAQQQNIELIKSQQEQNDKIQKLENEVNILQKRVSVLEKENYTLSRNISRLFMTAKKEIRQKEARIAELELNMPVAVEKLHCGTQTSEGELVPLKPITIRDNIIAKCNKDFEPQYNAIKPPDHLSNFLAKHSPSTKRSNSRESENKHRSRKSHKSRSRDQSSRYMKKRKRSRSRSRSRSKHRHRKSQSKSSKKRKRTRSRSRSRPRTRERIRSPLLPKCKQPSPVSSVDHYVELDPISLCDQEFEELCSNILEKEEVPELNATGVMHVEESPQDPNVCILPDPSKSINVEESPKEPNVCNPPDPSKSINVEESSKDPNICIPPDPHKMINVEESPKDPRVSNPQNTNNVINPPDPHKKILIENANNDKESLDSGPNDNGQVKQLINQMFVLMSSLQEQFQEQKELFNSMKKNAEKETAKTCLKFDQNSSNNVIFDESKRQITILKPTTIKFEAVTSESVLDNYYQQEQQQQQHGYKTTIVCPKTPPPSNHLIHHDRYMAIVSTPKKKPKTPTALDQQIKTQIKNLIPNRTSTPINNTIGGNSKVFQEVGKHEKINILHPRRWKRNVTTATTSTPVTNAVTASTKTPPVFHLNLSNFFNESAKAFRTPEKTMTLSQLVTKSPSMKNAAALSATIFDDNPVNDKEIVSHNIDAILKSMEHGNHFNQDYTVNSLFDVLTKMSKTTPPLSPTTVPPLPVPLPLPEVNKDAHLEISRKSLTDNNNDLEDGVIVDNLLLDKDASFKSLIDVMENSNMDVLQYYEEKMRKAEEDVVTEKVTTEPVEVKPKHSVCDRDMPKILGIDHSCDNSLLNVKSDLNKECDKIVQEKLTSDDCDKKRVIIKKDETITRSMTVSSRLMQAPMKPRRLSNIIDLDLTEDGNSIEDRSTPIKSAPMPMPVPVNNNKPKVRRAAKDRNLEKLKRIQKYFRF